MIVPKASLRLIREIFTNLYYEPITEILESPITISGPEQIVKSALEQISNPRNLIYQLEGLNEEYYPKQLGKYGLLKLSVPILNYTFDKEYEANLTLLKDLEFIPERRDRDEAAEFLYEGEDEFNSLEYLREMIEVGKTYLLLFFYSKLKANAKERYQRIELQNFYPIELKLTDACITNSEDVWMHKHFFL